MSFEELHNWLVYSTSMVMYSRYTGDDDDDGDFGVADNNDGQMVADG
jgi:hypothetical protein